MPLRVPAAVSALALVLALSGTPALAQSQSSSRQPGDPPAKHRKTGQDSQILKEVVVSGQRWAIQSAQRLKQVSPEIVDSIVAADIGKLPDRSVMEVLQRIPGISIDHTYRDMGGHLDPEHFNTEGAGLTIRGLTYVRSEVNGRDVFTANGGRSLSFDDVPPELLAGVDVYKNPSADQIEGGVGGLVNLRTARPFDFSGAKISSSVGGTWGDLSRGNVKPSASLLLSDRWHTGIGDIGVLADVSYAEVSQRTDSIEEYPYFPRVSSLEPKSTWIPAGQTVWVPGGPVSFRSQLFKRTREGVYTAVQWRPSDSLETTLSYFGSGYKFHWDESGIFSTYNSADIQPAPGTTFTFNRAGVFTQGTLTDPVAKGLDYGDDTRSADQHSVTSDLSWNLVWHATGRLTLRNDLQLVRSDTHEDDYTIGVSMNVPWEKVDLTGDLPVATLPQSFLSDPANYSWAFTQDGGNMSHGKEWAWSEDADYELGNGFFKKLSAGVRANERSADTDLTEPGNGYQWAAVSYTWMLGWNLPTLAYLNQFHAPVRVTNFPNFLNGQSSTPASVIFPGTSLTSVPGFALVQGFRTALCKQLNSSCNYAWTPASFVQAPGSPPLGGLNAQDEHTYAAYLEASFGSEVAGLPYDGNIGARVVRTFDTAGGFTTMAPFVPQNLPAGHSASEYVSFPGFSTPLSARNDYTNVLPSFNLRLHWTDHLQSRLAVSEGIARPDFSQLQAFTTLGSSIDNGTGVQHFTGGANGNPELKPTRAFQLDGTLEWYFAPTGSLTGDVFYKHLTDIVINRVFNMTATDSAGVTHSFTTTGPINGARGDLKGFEVGYQQYYDFLPGLLRGFGTQLNFTYIDSHQSVSQPDTGTYCEAYDTFSVNLNGCDTDGRAFGNLPLANLSKYDYNATLMYDRGPVSARLAYSWRSKYLIGTNTFPLQGTNGLNTDPSSPNYGQKNVTWGVPIYGDAYGQLDASVFYDITPNISVGVEGLNLTDALYRSLDQQHIGTHVYEWYGSGRTFSLQLRATL